MNIIKNCELNGQMYYPVGEHIQSNLKYIKTMSKCIEDYVENENINLWCRGSSGAIIAGLISGFLDGKKNVKIKHVKKPNENSHCSYNKICSLRKATNIIVDDFVETGSTVKAILDAFDKTESGCKIHLLIVSGSFSDVVIKKLEPRINNLICGKY